MISLSQKKKCQFRQWKHSLFIFINSQNHSVCSRKQHFIHFWCKQLPIYLDIYIKFLNFNKQWLHWRSLKWFFNVPVKREWNAEEVSFTTARRLLHQQDLSTSASWGYFSCFNHHFYLILKELQYSFRIFQILYSLNLIYFYTKF